MVQVDWDAQGQIEMDDEDVGRAAWEGYIESEVTDMIRDAAVEAHDGLNARLDRIEDALDAFIKVLRPATLLPKAVPKQRAPYPQVDQADDDMDAAYRARVAAITATEGTKEKANV